MHGPRYVRTGDRMGIRNRRAALGLSRTGQAALASVGTRAIIFLARRRWRFRFYGAWPSGPTILISRHNSYWDGLVVSMLDWRIAPVTSSNWRKVTLVGRYLNAYGVLWTDDDPIDKGLEVLRQRGMVWLAPAGFDRGDTPQIKTGVARLAMAAEVPVVPVSINILPRQGRRNVLKIQLGTPVSRPGNLTSAEDLARRCYEAVLHL